MNSSLKRSKVLLLGEEGYRSYMKSRLSYWVKKLKIDAVIRLNLEVHPDKVGGQGCIDYNITGKTARIEIVDRGWYKSQNFMKPQDPEVTLVHELLHYKYGILENSILGRGSVQYEVHHQIIDDIAHALVKIARIKGGRHESKYI